MLLHETSIDLTFRDIPAGIMEQLKRHDYQVKIISTAEGTETEEDVRFDKEHYLGSGITAHVLKTNTGVAKIFIPIKNSNAGFDELHLNEALLSTNLPEHKNIAKTIGVGKAKIGEQAYPCIIREYIPYGLEEKVANEEMDLEKSVKMVSDITEAVTYIYNKTGEVVTDLTSDDIRQRENGDWVLSDLGDTAKNGRDAVAGYDSVYSAPECKDLKTINKNATESSMVYSLSLILWESITGEKLSAFDIALGGINENQKIPVKLFTVLQKAASLDPNDRYNNPNDFMDAVRESLIEV